MTQLTIRIRLMMLSSALLLVLAATTGYLTHTLADEAAATAKAADMLAVADHGSLIPIQFIYHENLRNQIRFIAILTVHFAAIDSIKISLKAKVPQDLNCKNCGFRCGDKKGMFH